MSLSRLKSPWFYVPASLVLLLAVISAVIFNAAFQKKMLRDHVGPLVDSLAIGYVHLTPWSLEMNDVSVKYRGGNFSIGNGMLRFNLFSLLFHDANIRTLAVKGLNIDLEKFTPPPTQAKPAAGPFPGVLATLRHGLGYELHEVAVEAVVHLAGQRLISADITGGGIKPKSKGAINFKLHVNPGHQNDSIDVAGTLGLDQLTRGRFAAVQTSLAIQTALAALPQPEHVNLDLVVTPAAETARIALPTADEQKPHFAPEALRLGLQFPGVEGKVRSTLDLKGIYDGNTGDINGTYRITANQQLVEPYLKKVTIPPVTEVLSGEYTFDSVNLAGNMTVSSDLAVQDIRKLHPHEGLPEGLQLKNNFRVSLLPGKKLRVETLNSELFDSADQKRLESSLTGDLHIPLDAPRAFLHQDNTLLDFTLPSVPLAWFNVLVPDYHITDGTLTGAFEVSTDTNAAIHLKPLKPLQIKGLTVMRQGKERVKDLNLSVLPGVVYGGDALDISLKEIAVETGQDTVATADLALNIGLSKPGQTGITTQATAKVDLHRLLALLALKSAGVARLPRQLDLAYQATLLQQPGRLRADRLDATVSLGKTTELLRLHLLQPLVAETAPALRIQGDTAGELASLKCSDINLNWFSDFVSNIKLQGLLTRAELTVAADGKGAATLTSSRPVDLRHVRLTTSQGPMLNDLGIRLLPNIRFDKQGTHVDYRDLLVTSRQTKLISGSGQMTLSTAQGHPLLTDGHLDADLQALSKQPLIVRALKSDVEAPVRLQADYRLAKGDDEVDIDRLSAQLSYGDAEPRLSLQADSKLQIRTQLGGKQSEMARATGKVTVAISKLTPGPFAGILKARGVVFTQADGRAELVSDGHNFTVNTIAPLVISGITVRQENSAILQPFTLTSKGGAVMEGDTLQATLQQCSIAFAGKQNTPALDTHGNFTFKGVGSKVTLDSLQAELSASLPTLLAQPVVLPGHHLTAGTLTASLHKESDGKLSASARIGGLKAEKPLTLQSLSLDVNGKLTQDGGFNLRGPLGEQGKSGASDVLVQAGYMPAKDGKDRALSIDLNSSVFYLNDILSAVQTIDGKKTKQPKQPDKSEKEKSSDAKTERVALDLQPDARAFWDTTGYEVRLKFNLARLFYTDYLEFRGIQGHADLLPDRLEFGDFSAHFHDSPITLDGRMTFKPGQTPYDLKLKAGVEQFDLARFFHELVPGSTPRAEGLFDINLDAFGSSPNLTQYRNNLFFDMRLQSQKGVFRPFDPNSALLAGTSNIAGLIGEGVSNLPTGLFGLGAVARLVNYMKEINYDWMVVHLVRDQSRDVQIKEYVVQSNEILMTATGGITYKEGVDIVNSPVSVEARLDMRDRGAAILYSLGLLKSEKDSYGYWKGPVIKVWGNIAQTKSNLDEIISTAGRSAVLGGVTRPVSGLWGNLRYWWLGKEKKPTELENSSEKSTEKSPEKPPEQ